MKIATNVQRDAFGGITISNLALFDWLENTDDTIVGVEIVTSRHILGAIIFRRYQPSFFSHHIINGLDVIPRASWEKIGNLKRKWRVLIETTKNVLRQEVPDVVLVNGTYYASWILAQAARELGIPIVLRYAGVLQREVQHKNFFVRRRLLAHEQWLASIADAVIFPSALCCRVVEDEIVGRKIENGSVIPNPTKSIAIRSRKPNGRYTVAAIGRWTRIKNFQAFVALHEYLLAKRWPHRAIMVTSRIEEGFGIPETVERRASMSQEDLRSFYRSIDLLVVPSHFETFCNVASEALLNGASVLVSENVGFAEILRKAGLGRMVIKSFDNPAEVAKAVKRISKKKLTKQERDRVAALVDPQVVHEEIIEVLSNVLTEETF
jgi:glycosyltransferase involved in cell wall biosynthesis